jgi:hypothetical protein
LKNQLINALDIYKEKNFNKNKDKYKNRVNNMEINLEKRKNK